MAFVFAGLVLVIAIGMQLLVIMAEMSRPIPSGDVWAVFWPLIVGVPLAGLISASHWLRISW